MSAHVSTGAPSDGDPVPHTRIPRSRAAGRSIEALRIVVEAISFSLGSCASTAPGNGVRSRMTQTTSNGCSRSTIRSGSDRWSRKTVMLARPPSRAQSAKSSATP